MKRSIRAAFAVIGGLLFALLVGPFLVRFSPLEDTVPPEDLADLDSRFIDVHGIKVHYKVAGQGARVLVLLHGFAASLFSWREVMAPLSTKWTVIAFDRPAFGLTARPMPGDWRDQNPYSPEGQADLTVALMDALGVQKATLVGHSAGGLVAALTALRHPERVDALVLVDPAIYSGGGPPGFLKPLLRTPQVRQLGPLLARTIATLGDRLAWNAWHDPSKLTAEIWQGYRKPLQADNWDRALWELTLASHSLNLGRRLDELQVPVLVITGDDDRIVPTKQSLRLARSLPGATLALIPDCGHVPHEECPVLFLQAVAKFLDPKPPRI